MAEFFSTKQVTEFPKLMISLELRMQIVNINGSGKQFMILGLGLFTDCEHILF